MLESEIREGFGRFLRLDISRAESIQIPHTNLEIDLKKKQEIIPNQENPERGVVEVINWICKCGGENASDHPICLNGTCIKPGVEGWICKACTYLNPKTNFHCYSCWKVYGRTFQLLNQKKENTCTLCKRKIIGDWCNKCRININWSIREIRKNVGRLKSPRFGSYDNLDL